MHDQPIQLDAGFDSMPHLSVSSWLHTIDSRVVSGEPVVIIDDGTTQRVVTAPCTGRIVDIYTEAGATVLPRTVLGMVRPDLIVPEPTKELGSIIVGLLLIGLAVIAVAVITNVSPISVATPDTALQPNPPSHTDTPTIDSPMPDAPAPGTSPSDDITNPDVDPSQDQIDPNAIIATPEQSSDPADDGSTDTTDPNQFLEPTPDDTTDDTTIEPSADNDDPNSTADDATSDSQVADDTTDTTSDQQTGRFMSNDEINELFMVNLDRIITLTKEVEQNLPSGVMSQSEYDTFVFDAAEEVVFIIDELNTIYNDNRNNTDINQKNQQWFALFIDSKDECLSIYATIKQAVNTKQPIPNLASSFTQCYLPEDNF